VAVARLERREPCVQGVEIVVALVVVRGLGRRVEAAEVEVAPEAVDVEQPRGPPAGGARGQQRRRVLRLATAVEPVDGDDATGRRGDARHAGGRMRQSGVNSWISAAPAREIATISR